MWTPQEWYEQARASAAASAEQIRSKMEFMLDVYARAMPGASREHIGKTLADSNRARLDAVPSLTTYPELRGVRGLIAAQWRGARDGAGLDDAQAAVHANGLFHYHRVLARNLGRHKANCSIVYFPNSDHGPLLGTNLDTDPNEPYGPPGWPTVSEHLITGGVSSGVFMDEESPEIFPAPVWQIVGRYARTAAEAVEILTRYNHFWGPGNMIVIDRAHRVAMIEKSACRIGVRWSPDGFGFVTAMTAEEPAMHAYLADRRAASLVARGLPNPCADTRYWAAQDTRRAIMNRLLDDARKAPTLARMQALMQYRGADGVVADNGEILHPGDPPIEHTIRTQVFCLARRRALWWTRDNARNIPSWENRREDVVFSDVDPWE